MVRAALKHELRSRFLAALLAASLGSGCQPAGTGSIDIDARNPTVRGFKTIETGKGPSAARTSKQRAGKNSAPRTGFR
jgi:hypothetical protein